jgi:exodeoxyribonuclease VII small subunit
MAKQDNAVELSFEQRLEALEALVEKLEGGDLPLEKAVATFEEGMTLSASLTKTLDAAEKRIEVLIEKATGEIERRELDLDDDGEG